VVSLSGDVTLSCNEALGSQVHSNALAISGSSSSMRLIEVAGKIIPYGGMRDTTGAAAGGPAGVASSGINQMAYCLRALDIETSSAAVIAAGIRLTEWLGFGHSLRCAREMVQPARFVYCLLRHGAITEIEEHATAQALFNWQVTSTFEVSPP